MKNPVIQREIQIFQSCALKIFIALLRSCLCRELLQINVVSAHM